MDGLFVVAGCGCIGDWVHVTRINLEDGRIAISDGGLVEGVLVGFGQI